jgi:hypothetical protein
MMGGVRKDLPSRAIPVSKVQTVDSPRPLKRIRKKVQRISPPKDQSAANDKMT